MCIFRKLKIHLLPSMRLYSFDYSFSGILCVFVGFSFTHLLNMSSPIINLLSHHSFPWSYHVPHSPISLATTSNYSQDLNSNSDFMLSFGPLKSSGLLNISCGYPKGISSTAVQKQVGSLYLQSTIMYCTLNWVVECSYHNKSPSSSFRSKWFLLSYHVFIVSVYLVAHTRNFTSYILLLSHINTEVMSCLIQKQTNKKPQVFEHPSYISHWLWLWDWAVNKTKPCSHGAYILIEQDINRYIYQVTERTKEKRAGLGENDRGVGGCLSILRWSGKTSDKGTFAQGPEGSKEAKPCTYFGYEPFRRRWARKLPCCQAGMNKRQVVGNDIRVLDVRPQRRRDGFWNLFWEKQEALGGM